MLELNAVHHREVLMAELKTVLFPRLSVVLGSKAKVIGSAADINTFFGPAESLEQPLMCDTLCALLDTPVGTIAILHARQSPRGPEGPGRTSLLLHNLGVELSWAFRHVCPEEIHAAGKILLKRRASVSRALVSSDYAYLWCDKGRLKAMKPLAEPLLGLWDLARYIFRRTDPKYFPGKRGTPEGRQILYALTEVLPVNEFLSCYSPENHPRYIDLAIVLEISERGDLVIELPLKELSDTKEILRVAFESILDLHRTPFWERDQREYKQVVNCLLTNLEFPPEILHISIPSSVIVSDKFGLYIHNISTLVEQRIIRMRR